MTYETLEKRTIGLTVGSIVLWFVSGLFVSTDKWYASLPYLWALCCLFIGIQIGASMKITGR